MQQRSSNCITVAMSNLVCALNTGTCAVISIDQSLSVVLRSVPVNCALACFVRFSQLVWCAVWDYTFGVLLLVLMCHVQMAIAAFRVILRAGPDRPQFRPRHH